MACKYIYTSNEEILDISEFSDENTFYRVVHGTSAYEDIVKSGLVRTNAESKPIEGLSLKEKLALRPTSFPSFSKGEASISYAQENPNNYIIVTSDPSIKPSTAGRHSKGNTMFPTDETGRHLTTLDAKAVKVYKHIENNKYQLVYDMGTAKTPTGEYTKAELFEEIETGRLSPKMIDEQKSRKILSDYFGETYGETQMSVVMGLIDGKALGQHQEDSSILLSSLATESVVHHEAFHRAWQLLSQEERDIAVKEFKKKKDWKDLIAVYQDRYGTNEDVLIEEYFADEFADFVLGEPTPKTFLQKLFDKLKKILQAIGLVKQPEIERIYNLLKSGGFKSASIKGKVFRKANAIKVGNIDITVERYTPILDSFHRKVVKSILESNNLDDFLANSPDIDSAVNKRAIATEVLNELWDVEIEGKTLEQHLSKAPSESQEAFNSWFNNQSTKLQEAISFLEAVQDDFMKDNPTILNKYNSEYIKQFRLKQILNDDSAADDKKEMSQKTADTQLELEKEKAAAGEGAFYDKNSFEVDPNSSMSASVKLLLSSLEDPTELSSIGIPKTYNWKKFSDFLYENLSGLEPRADVFLNKMLKLVSHKKYGSGIQQLLDRFENFNSENRDLQKAAIKFISHFAKTQNSFLVSEIGKDKTAVFNATDKAKIDFVKKTMDSYFKAAVAKSNLPKFEEELRAISNIKGTDKLNKLVTLFGFDKIVDSLIDDAANTFKIKLDDLAKHIVGELNKKTKKSYLDIFVTQEDVKGITDSMFNAVLESGTIVELSVINSVGEKVYGISQNMYMTQLVNKINYHLNRINEEYPSATIEDMEQLLVESIPQLKNVIGHSFFLRNLINTAGKSKIQFLINNGVQTETTKIDRELSELEETTLLSVYINQLLDPMSYPIFQTAKHSDRSVLYSIRYNNSVTSQQNKLPVNAIGLTVNDFKDNASLRKVFENYLRYEKKKLDLIKSGAFATVQNMNGLKLDNGKLTNKSIEGMLFRQMTDLSGNKIDILTLEDYQNLMNGNEGDANWNRSLDKILKAAHEQAEKDHNYLVEKGIYEPVNNVPIGVAKEIWDARADGISGWTNGIKTISYLYSVNSLIGYIDQSIMFTGDPALYKNAADTFKRLNTLSSTGDLSVVGNLSDGLIRSYETETPIIDSKGKKSYYYEKEHATDTQMIATATFAEEDDYYLSDDVLNDYEKRSFESMKEMLVNIGYSEQEATSKAKEHASRIKDSYSKTNEPDGQSWLNLFEWRRTKVRWGQWSDAHERLFQMELAIFNGEKTFVIPEGKDAVVFMNEFLGLAETIKGQYYGPYWTNLSKNDDFVVQGVAKTSFYPMLPSQIRGTKLEKLNRAAVEVGLGVVHVGSARKVGQRIMVDKNNVPLNGSGYVKGLPAAYNNSGELNTEAISDRSKLNNLVQYMDAEYFKHQVFIPNKEKNKVTSSTQSFKLTLSNLFNNGVPIDVKATKEEWENMTDVEKEDSKIYQYVRQYSQLAESRIKSTIDELEAKINFNSDKDAYNDYKQLIDILKESLSQRGATKNVFDVLDIFEKAEVKAIELLPNRFRIEPVLYSLIRNDVTTQKRNGNSVPQVTSLWWDPIDKKRGVKTEAGKVKIQASAELGMYENGKNYAEVMMPLPTKWLNGLMDIYGTRDLIRLVDLINDDIKKNNFNKIDEKMLFLKGLRIPNQQLSSNDAFRVKKFLVPTNTAMVVVPPLIAVKVGSDFDIDKLTMYIAHGEAMNGKFRYINERFVKDKETEVKEKKELSKGLLDQSLGLYNSVVPEENRIVFNREKGKKDISMRRKQNILIFSINNLLKEGKIDKGTKEQLEQIVSTLKALSFNNTMNYDEKLEENELLEAELGIMQLPINFMNLMKPTDDTAWKVDARGMLREDSKKANKENDPKKKKFYKSLATEDLTLFDVYTAKTNVQKTIENIMSKDGVGQVAVSITNHAVNQLYGFKIRLKYMVGERSDGTPIYASRNLNFFEQDNGDFADIVNKNAEFISDLLSGLLTSQVDAVKDPYAKSLGLVGDTLNVATYLLQRGVSHEDIVYFFAQPAVKDYIERKAKYKGLLYMENGVEMKKKTNIEKWFKENDIPYDPSENLAYLEIKKEYIESGIKEQPIEAKGAALTSLLRKFDDSYQMAFLDMYNKLFKESLEHRTFMSAVGLDTFKGKGIADVYERQIKIDNAGGEKALIENYELIKNQGLMRPFREAFDKYKQFFFPLYLIENNRLKKPLLDEIIPSVNINSEKRMKLYKTIPEDFGTFLIQNFSDFFKDYSFMSIMTGNNSVPKELYRMIQNNEYKLGVFEYLLPQFEIASIGSVGIDAIRKSDLSDNLFQLNEYNEELEELRIRNPEFFKRLLAYTFYSYGVSNSIFSLESVMPIKSINALGKESVSKESIMGQVLKEFSELSEAEKSTLANKFARIFRLANAWMHKSGKAIAPQREDDTFMDYADVMDDFMLVDEYEEYNEGFQSDLGNIDEALQGSEEMMEREDKKKSQPSYIKRYNMNTKSFIIEEKVGNKTTQYYPLGGFGYKAFNINEDVMMVGRTLEEQKRDLSLLMRKIEPSISEPVQQQGSVLVQPTTPSVLTGTTAQPTITEQQVDQIFKNNLDLAQVIFKEFDIDYKYMSNNGKEDWVYESVLGDSIGLRESLTEAEEGQYPSKKELKEKEEEYRKYYTAIDTAAKQTYIEYVKKEGLNEDIEKLKKFLPTSLAISTYRAEKESRKKCKGK